MKPVDQRPRILPLWCIPIVEEVCWQLSKQLIRAGNQRRRWWFHAVLWVHGIVVMRIRDPMKHALRTPTTEQAESEAGDGE